MPIGFHELTLLCNHFKFNKYVLKLLNRQQRSIIPHNSKSIKSFRVPVYNHFQTIDDMIHVF